MILERIAEERLSRVVPVWGSFPVVLMGGGPSMTFEQIMRVGAARERGDIRVIAINDSYLVAPWADVVYAADAKWFTWHKGGIVKPKLDLSAPEVREKWARFAGQKAGLAIAGKYVPEDVHMLRVAPDAEILSRDPRALATGRQNGHTGHSGFQALNLATLGGARLIILLGYDGGPNERGQTHFHGEHPIPTHGGVWEYVRSSFRLAENELKADGIRVINCSPGSVIPHFEKMPLEAALAEKIPV